MTPSSDLTATLATQLADFVNQHGGRGSPAAAADMLCRALALHPVDEADSLTRYDAVRVICRKWLARRCPPAALQAQQSRDEIRQIASRVAGELTGNMDSLLSERWP
ncbi:MAG: hypothetical protein KC502_18030 [Myxococcales bacterium]|nr:hypothetical protein [Myxococcales bacterium]